MKKNNIKRSQLIAKRKKQFFALVLSVILAIMPTTTAMAFTLDIDSYDNLDRFNSLNLHPGTDSIKLNMTSTGGLNVVYRNKAGVTIGEFGPMETSNMPYEYVIEDKSIAEFDHWKVNMAERVDDRYTYAKFTLVPILKSEGGRLLLLQSLKAQDSLHRKRT